MNIPPELFSETGLSAAILGLLGTIAGYYFKDRSERRNAEHDIKTTSLQALESSQTVAENTRNISNGFAARMDRKLDTVISQQQDFERAFREHLEWHLNKEA